MSGLRRGTRVGWRARLVGAGFLATLLATGSAHGGLNPANEALQAELKALTVLEQMTLLQRALDSRETARHELGATWSHASSDRLRRLDAYRRQTLPHQRAQRARVNMLLRFARGGAARLLWGRAQSNPHEQRVTAHLLRNVARHQLERIGVDVRLQRDIESETLAAARAARDDAALAALEGALAPGLDLLGRQLLARADDLARKRERSASRKLATAVDRLRSRIDERALVLRSPVVGPIVARFGGGRDPLTHVPVQRRGVEISTRAFAPVRAALDGEVVWTGSLAGYQHAVVIRHDDGHQTLTARLWRPAVAVGDHVKAGDILGQAAPKGLPDGLGESIYFELRKGEQPVDPEPLLARSRG